MVRKGSITDKSFNISLQQELSKRQSKLMELDTVIDSLTMDQIYGHVFDVEDMKKEKYIDFIKIIDERISSISREGRDGTAKAYMAARNSLCRFISGESIDINSITKSFLVGYVEDLQNKGVSNSTINTYKRLLSAAHSYAENKYNDEEQGILLVKYHPFKRVAIEVGHKSFDNSVSKEFILRMHKLELPDGKLKTARDVFMISFILCGMNMKDMFDLKSIDDDKISYMRSKSKRRSGENSRIVLNIPDIVRPYIEAHNGKNMAFDFAETFGTIEAFKSSTWRQINQATKMVVAEYMSEFGCSEDKAKKALGINGKVTFYSARYSFASIAANECGISAEVVDRCLCHAPSTIAERNYISRDYKAVNEAMNRVVEYVFGK